MKDLLKSLKLSDNAIELYNLCYGRDLLTFSELRSLQSELSDKDFISILNELFNKNLISEIKPLSQKSLKQYLILPPFSVISNTLKELNTKIGADDSLIKEEIGKELDNILQDKGDIEIETLYNEFQKIQEGIEKDAVTIREELKDLVNSIEQKEVSSDFLNKFEEELKHMISAQLASIVIILLQLKADFEEKIKAVGITQNQWDAVKNEIKDALALGTHEKAQELNELISEEFADIKEAMDSIIANRFERQVEQNSIYLGILKFFKSEINKIDHLIVQKKKLFYTEMTRLERSIKTNVSAKVQGVFNKYLGDLKVVKDVISNLVEHSSDKMAKKRFWLINSKYKVKDEISRLLKVSKEQITIIVPEIEGYIPLEKFELDYTKDETVKNLPEGPAKSHKTLTKPSHKKEKEELNKKFAVLKKTAGEVKGFELSHNVADSMALVSEINPNSVVLESMKGWLNRLLVIRKLLDQNLLYKLLEDIEKWENDYLKEQKDDLASQTEESEERGDSEALKINIVSSNNHKDKNVLAFKRDFNIKYKKSKNNELIGINADNSYLIIGLEKFDAVHPLEQIIGFATDYKPFIEILLPYITKKWKNAKYSKQLRVRSGYNQIKENITIYSGAKIGPILKDILEVVFKQEKLSLDLLQVKLLANKISKVREPLSDDIKQDLNEKLEILTNELTKLNYNLTPTAESEIAEELPFRIQAKTSGEELIYLEEKIVEPIDSEAFNNSIDIFVENLDKLSNKDISNQLGTLINLVLQKQGVANLAVWKEVLKTSDASLDEVSKFKLVDNLKKLKAGGLSPTTFQQPIQTRPSGKELLTEAPRTQPEASPEVEVSAPSPQTGDAFENIFQGIDSLKGFEIGKKLQDIMDDILETKGYDLSLKDMKPWISKLRFIKNPLDEKIKEEFLPEFNKWKERYN